jgi:tetratricopeptide (TPR) repeat protein
MRASFAEKNHVQRTLLAQSDQPLESFSSTNHQEWMISQLNDVVDWNPRTSWAHQKLAIRYLELFESVQEQSENRMTISMVRDAAMASNFGSSKALKQWLIKAFGENANNLYTAYSNARKAINLNPLKGEAYLILAELCFLEGGKLQDVDAYLAMSLRVRPQDVIVLFNVGKQHLMLGQVEQAMHYWRKAFRSCGSHQLRLVQHMVGRVTASEFIEYFQPDWNTLGVVWKRYRNVGNSEDLKVLAEYAAGIAEANCIGKSTTEQVHIWLTLSTMQTHFEDHKGALESLQQAYQIAPSNYRVRSSLGHCLFQSGHYLQAEGHLRWCLARQPNNKSIQKDLVSAVEGRTAMKYKLSPSQQFSK